MCLVFVTLSGSSGRRIPWCVDENARVACTYLTSWRSTSWHTRLPFFREPLFDREEEPMHSWFVFTSSLRGLAARPPHLALLPFLWIPNTCLSHHTPHRTITTLRISPVFSCVKSDPVKTGFICSESYLHLPATQHFINMRSSSTQLARCILSRSFTLSLIIAIITLLPIQAVLSKSGGQEIHRLQARSPAGSPSPKTEVVQCGLAFVPGFGGVGIAGMSYFLGCDGWHFLVECVCFYHWSRYA